MAQSKLNSRESKRQEIIGKIELLNEQIEIIYEAVEALQEEYEYLDKPGFYIPRGGFKLSDKKKVVKRSVKQLKSSK